MSSIATLNGVQYIVPAYNDTGWAQGAGNLSLYLAAIAANTLQPTGGSFTLTADVDFGASFGLKALFLKTETANPASAGVIRLAKTDSIKWRNNANGADIALAIDGSDNLLYAANKVYTAGGAAGIVNADIAAGAAIAYSKLALTGAILNADLAGSIAYSKLSLTGAILNADLAGSIAYSKLTLTGAIVNGDLTAGTILNTAINASAAIALTKLAALTSHSRALASDSSGFIVESAVTATELGYVSGVTSAIQTQLNATVTLPLAQNLTFDNYATHGVQGTNSNTNAAAGNVGEYVEALVSSGTSFATSGTNSDATSISLTAGDWDITATLYGSIKGITTTIVTIGISQTSGNSTTGLVLGSNYFSLPMPVGSASQETSGCIAGYRQLLSGTTTIYFKILATYSGTTPTYGCRLSARRRR